MNTSAKGELAVLKVLERCIDRDVIASRPTTECNRYDLVLDVDGKLWRAQVKYGNGGSGQSSGCVSVRLASVGRKGERAYSSQEIDVILVYLPKTDKVYWLPKEVWEGKGRLSIRLEPTKNKQGRRCNTATDFEW